MSSISGAGSSPIQTHVIPVAKRRVIELIAELEELEKGDATTNATAIKGVIAELRDSYHIDVDKGTILIGSRKTPHQVEVRASGDSWRPVKTLDSLTERAKVLWLHAPMMQEAAKQSSKAATGHIEAEGTFEWSAKGKLSKGEIALDQAPLPGRLKKFTQYFMGYQPYEKLVKVATGKSVARPFAHVVHEVADLAQEVFQQDRVPNYPLQIAYRIGELVVNEVKNSLGDTASPLIQKLRDSITDPAFQGRFETALKKCQTAMTQGQSHDNALARLYVEVGSLCGPVIQAIMDDESWQKNKTVFGMSRPDVAERGEALESILKQMTTDLQAALAAGSAVPAAATPPVATRPPLLPSQVTASRSSAASAAATPPVAATPPPLVPHGAASRLPAASAAAAAAVRHGLVPPQVTARRPSVASAAAASTPPPAADASANVLMRWVQENRSMIQAHTGEDLISNDLRDLGLLQLLLAADTETMKKAYQDSLVEIASAAGMNINDWLASLNTRVFGGRCSPPK